MKWIDSDKKNLMQIIRSISEKKTTKRNIVFDITFSNGSTIKGCYNKYYDSFIWQERQLKCGEQVKTYPLNLLDIEEYIRYQGVFNASKR